MADVRISDLVVASQLKDDDYYEIAQAESGTRVSYRTTLLAIAVQIATAVQLTSDLTTDSKTLAGAINELKQKISLIPKFSIDVVQTLPTEDISDTTIYLVPSDDPETENAYDEYINLTGTTSGWEKIGSTDIDMSAYYTKLEVDGLLADKLEADDFEASQTSSANPIILETKQAGLARSCAVSFGPIQDLHGYDHPWAGGAGKNKLPFDIDAIKADNTNGTWTGNNYTIRNVTFAFNDDGTVLATRSATDESASSVRVLKDLVLPAGTYIINGITGGASSTYRIRYALNGGTYVNVYNGDSDNIVMNGTDTITVQLYVYGSYETPTGGITFEPMIRLSSVADSTFEPYENICPISERTEASVTRTGVNQWDGVTEVGGVAEADGSLNTNTNFLRSKNPIRIYESFSYYGYSKKGNQLVFYFYDKNMNYLGFRVGTNAVTTPPSNSYYARIRMPNYGSYLYEDGDISINYPSTDTKYHAYQGETHTKEFGQTVLGGSLDFVNGGATSEQGKLVLDGTENWTADTGRNGVYYLFNTMALSTYADCVCDRFKTIHSNAEMQSLGIAFGVQNKAIYIPRLFDGAISGVTDVASWKTYLSNNNMEITYPKATPTAIQLSPEPVTLLKGLNVISTDGDKVQVEFSDIPVGDYSALLDYIKSLEDRIKVLEG